MNSPPKELDGALVVYHAVVSNDCHYTGKCRHSVEGAVVGPAAVLAICQYRDDKSYYLFYCDADWKVLADTWHETVEDAMHQAEFEYEGVGEVWEPRPGG